MKCLATPACTGCGACFNACNHHAITMREDRIGFKYPEVCEEKCNDCGKCEKACPLLHDVTARNDKEPACRAVMAQDDIRRVSSSGGIFTVLAEAILDEGGIVYGAAFDERMQVRHIGVERKEALARLRGSKYIQSDTGLALREVRSHLKSGRKVLFTGCPCQVAGLLGFLGDREYPNLYTADLICHGVPSQKTFDKYLAENFPNRHIKKVTFREKFDQWAGQTYLNVVLDSGSQKISSDQSSYYSFFGDAMSMRDSCYVCRFASIPRPGDLTIGDFWGICSYDNSLNDGLGTSVVLVNNEKGKALYDRVAHCLKLSSKVPLPVAVVGNPHLKRPSTKNPLRDEFMNNYDKLTLEQNAAHLKGYKFDCAILNMWWGNNYGAVLTGYALQQAVKRLGYTSVLVNNSYTRDADYEKEFFGGFAYRFARDHMVFSNRYAPNQLAEINALSDRFLVGSDQVMRFGANLIGNDVYFLKFADYEKIKIAFSASFALNGPDWAKEVPDLFMERYKFLLGRFDDISTRELSGVDLCKDYFGMPAKCIIDPVFTLDKETLDKLVGESSLQKKDYLLAYVLDENDELSDTIAKIAADKGLEVVHIRIGEDSIQDWLYLIKNASYVITDSFHGLCFSIIFNRPVRCLINIMRGNDRVISIQTMLGLPKSVLFSDPKNLLEEQEIDYDAVNARIKERADECMSHLDYVMKIRKDISEEGRKAEQLLAKKALRKIYEFHGLKRVKYKCKKVMYKVLFILLRSQAFKHKYQYYKSKLKREVDVVMREKALQDQP